jgi:hypothetical protein
MVSTKKGRRADLDSPESQVSPYEDFDTKQRLMTGEKFPVMAVGICDNCHWCYTLLNERGSIKVCPICNMDVSQIPMSLDEVCIIEDDEKRGFTITFDRKLPLR